MKSIKIFCPATIANVSCGFDILGLALDAVGDYMIVHKSDTPGIRITKILGQDLPLDPQKNVAGVAALALLQQIDVSFGFDIEIDKRIKPGSGIGSSAASAAGAVFAINALLGYPFSKNQLVGFAMKGEELAGGIEHADNVAPAIFGGITLVRSCEPLDIVSLKTPSELYITVIHPQIEVKTSDARNILKENIPLKNAVKQWGNVGGLISGLYTEDYSLISRSMEDFVIEPIRSILIPSFYQLKEKILEAGALGSGISGSGPSVFALSKGEKTAQNVAKAMQKVYKQLDIDFEIHLSKINEKGIKIIEQQ
jgi:homoserine kinase